MKLGNSTISLLVAILLITPWSLIAIWSGDKLVRL